MKKLMSVFLTLIAIFIIAAIALRLAVPRLSANSVAGGITQSDTAPSLADCPDIPNCTGSESTRQAQKTARFMISSSDSEAIERMASLINTISGTTIVSQDKQYLHATFTTRIMGYIDDVEFLLSDDKKSLQVRSASRLGKSDLGANARRIEELRTLASGKL